jgi:hypothetical protein
MTKQDDDRMLLVGLVDIAHVVRRGKRVVRVWIVEKGLPAFRIDGKGPWCVLHGDLLEWFRMEKRRSQEKKGRK